MRKKIFRRNKINLYKFYSKFGTITNFENKIFYRQQTQIFPKDQISYVFEKLISVAFCGKFAIT